MIARAVVPPRDLAGEYVLWTLQPFKANECRGPEVWLPNFFQGLGEGRRRSRSPRHWNRVAARFSTPVALCRSTGWPGARACRVARSAGQRRFCLLLVRRSTRQVNRQLDHSSSSANPRYASRPANTRADSVRLHGQKRVSVDTAGLDRPHADFSTTPAAGQVPWWLTNVAKPDHASSQGATSLLTPCQVIRSSRSIRLE